MGRVTQHIKYQTQQKSNGSHKGRQYRAARQYVGVFVMFRSSLCATREPPPKGREGGAKAVTGVPNGCVLMLAAAAAALTGGKKAHHDFWDSWVGLATKFACY